MVDGCLFCGVVSGDIPADVVAETDFTVAFRDIAPKAPVHVLVVPREHHSDLATLTDDDPQLAGRLVADAVAAARGEGLDGRFRLVVNTGAETGQSVFHVHLHVLGGRPFAWPPG